MGISNTFGPRLIWFKFRFGCKRVDSFIQYISICADVPLRTYTRTHSFIQYISKTFQHLTKRKKPDSSSQNCCLLVKAVH